DRKVFLSPSPSREKSRPLFPKGPAGAWRGRILRWNVPTAGQARFSSAQLESVVWIAAVRPAGQRARQNRGARSESLRSKQFLSVERRARTPSNRPTSCETNHIGQSRVRAMRSSRGIFSSRHNNKVGRATKGAAPDASARIGFSTPEFRFADCRRRSLCPKIRPDTMRATFQKHGVESPAANAGENGIKQTFR